MARLDIESFAHVVAHDLAGPIRAVATYIGLLERALDAGDVEKAKERLALCMTPLRRADGMLRRIRDFSKVHAAEGAGPSDVRALAEEAWERVDSDFGFAIDGEATAQASPLAVSLILSELLHNAVRHHDGAGHVQVVIGDDIRVIDDGPGIEQVDAVLQPFSLQHTTIDEGGGTGLSLARLVAEECGGSLRLHSEGRGTTAIVTLPFVSA